MRLLEEANPAFRVVSEPLTRWLNIPAEEDVSKINYNYDVIALIIIMCSRVSLTIQGCVMIARSVQGWLMGLHVHVYYTTIELLNNGHIGSGPFVLYMEVVPLQKRGRS